MTRKHITGLVVTFVAGLVIGGAATDDSQQVADLRNAHRARLADLEGDIAAARRHATAAEARASEARSEEASAAGGRAERAARRAIARREAQLEARAGELDSRERAVSGLEREFEANTIPGDGRFLVGADIRPGTYRADTPSSGNCYWARLASDSGGIEDIVQNGNVAGPVTITVASSDHMLELSGCSEFHRIR